MSKKKRGTAGDADASSIGIYLCTTTLYPNATLEATGHKGKNARNGDFLMVMRKGGEPSSKAIKNIKVSATGGEQCMTKSHYH